MLGMIYSMIISKIFLNDFTVGNWRGMLVAGAVPSLIVFLGTLIYVKESPRFLVAQGKGREGCFNSKLHWIQEQ